MVESRNVAGQGILCALQEIPIKGRNLGEAEAIRQRPQGGVEMWVKQSLDVEPVRQGP